MTTKKAAVNLTDILKDQFGADKFEKDEIETYEVELFGETFKVLAGTPVASLQSIFNSQDRGASARFLLNLIHADDHDRFTAAIEKHPALRGDPEESTKILMSIANLLLEVASGGHPTTSSNGSSRSTAKRAASKRSAAG